MFCIEIKKKNSFSFRVYLYRYYILYNIYVYRIPKHEEANIKHQVPQ